MLSSVSSVPGIASAVGAPDAGALVVALGIGLLIGVDRERRKDRDGAAGAAGLRTFALVAVLGALLGAAEPAAVPAIGLGFVAALGLAPLARGTDAGLTTSVALVTTYALGVLAIHDAELAAASGVGVALLLAERSRLHDLVRDRLSEREVLDGLLLAACALIVLPLLPDEGVGPGGALNPVTVWRLAVAIMLINAASYVALRALGPQRGLRLAGFLGGFVSATATTAAMGTRARSDPSLRRPAAAAAFAATGATFVFTAIVLALTDAGVLLDAAPALVAGGLASLVVVVVAGRGGPGSAAVGGEPARGRAFDLKVPLAIAVTITVVVTAADLLGDALGSSGALTALGLGGFADAQSAAISAASLARAGTVEAGTAALGVVIAITTNTMTKAGAALTFPGRRAVGGMWLGLGVITGAMWGGYAAGALLV